MFSIGVRWDQGTSNCPRPLKQKDPNKKLGRIANSVAKPSIVMWKLVPSMVMLWAEALAIDIFGLFLQEEAGPPNIATKTHAKGLVPRCKKNMDEGRALPANLKHWMGFGSMFCLFHPFPRMYIFRLHVSFSGCNWQLSVTCFGRKKSKRIGKEGWA